MGSTWVYSLQKIVITTLTSKKNTRNNLCSAWIPCFFLVLKRFTLSIVIQFFLSFFLQRRRYLPRWWRDKAVTASLEVFGGGEIGLDRCCSSCSWWYDQKHVPTFSLFLEFLVNSSQPYHPPLFLQQLASHVFYIFLWGLMSLKFTVICPFKSLHHSYTWIQWIFPEQSLAVFSDLIE